MYLIRKRGVDLNSYVQPRAYFEIDDHRFDKLRPVGEGQWDEIMPDLALEREVPMTEIKRN